MSFETIKDIVNFNPSRRLPKGKEAPFIDMAALPVNSRNIKEISTKIFNGGGAKFKNGDTLFARITPCLENGKTAKVSDLQQDSIGYGSTEFIVLSAKSKDDEDFVYYLARFSDFRNYAVSRMEGTSGRQRVSWQALAEFELPLPDKAKRKKIGEILRSLDDQIHLNNQINKTLESIAQAIFKSWFIDFDSVKAKIQAKLEGKDSKLAAMCVISGKSEAEIQQMAKEDFAELHATATLFPDELVDSELGQVPKGWKVSTVGEQIHTVGGATPSTKNSEFWENGEYYWTTPKDLSNSTDKILLNTDRKITDAGLKKISSGLLPKNTVLMSSRAPVGYLALAKIEVAINQGYIAILPNEKFPAEYLIQWCEANMAEIKGRSSGTTFQEISKKNFREINFICPDDKVVAAYTKIVKTLYDEITLKAKEIQSIQDLRDTLLPKLLSGKVNFSMSEDTEYGIS